MISRFLKIPFFIIIFFLFCKNSFPQTILIGSGEPMGRSGDIAANLLMAQHLRRTLPEIKIVVYVTPNSMEVISNLVPEITTYPPGHIYLEKNGVLYVSPNLFIPSNDESLIFHISFSTPEIPLPEHFNPQLNIPSIISFWEYRGKNSQSKEPPDSLDLKKNRIKTGPRFSGLYISREGSLGSSDEIPPRLNNQEIELLQRAQDQEYLGYTYSEGNVLSTQYVKKLAEYAEENSITIFTNPKSINYFASRGTLLRKNVTLRSNSISFDLTKAIVKRTNLPQLVRGDISLSLAIEYGKPFVYEVSEHKRSLAIDLIKLFPKILCIEQGTDFFMDFDLQRYSTHFFFSF